jgi:poly(3-hydroxybutyrate) depolymerase
MLLADWRQAHGRSFRGAGPLFPDRFHIGIRVIYQAYQAYEDMMRPWRLFARMASTAALGAWEGAEDFEPARKIAAAYELIAVTGLTHKRPAFNIPSVSVRGEEIAVTESAAAVTPFCTLLRFAKQDVAEQPKVLLVAPMSGHFATLLRGTARTMLKDHEVYITDWHNARDVSCADGRFGLDEYILHLIQFLEVMGPNSHIVAVCQPTVPALAAVALMAEDENPASPRSMTLMAGPIDARIHPTSVNVLATERPIEWFENNLIGTVPLRYAGAMRRVYPGFLQLAAFMSMNRERHMHSFIDMYQHRVHRENEKAETIREFYAEYFATMDLPAEFYLETVNRIFQEYALAKGELTVRGRKVNPAAIRRTALLTVEGEKDDICSVGQTLAAQDLCPRIRPYMKMHHVQPGVGHYGVFNGRRWESGIYPLVRETIHRYA